MTPQEQMDDRGYAVVASKSPYRLGETIEIYERQDSEPMKAVVIGYSDEKEFLSLTNGFKYVPRTHKYFHKVVAE